MSRYSPTVGIQPKPSPVPAIADALTNILSAFAQKKRQDQVEVERADERDYQRGRDARADERQQTLDRLAIERAPQLTFENPNLGNPGVLSAMNQSVAEALGAMYEAPVAPDPSRRSSVDTPIEGHALAEELGRLPGAAPPEVRSDELIAELAHLAGQPAANIRAAPGQKVSLSDRHAQAAAREQDGPTAVAPRGRPGDFNGAGFNRPVIAPIAEVGGRAVFRDPSYRTAAEERAGRYAAIEQGYESAGLDPARAAALARGGEASVLTPSVAVGGRRFPDTEEGRAAAIEWEREVKEAGRTPNEFSVAGYHTANEDEAARLRKKLHIQSGESGNDGVSGMADARAQAAAARAVHEFGGLDEAIATFERHAQLTEQAPEDQRTLRELYRLKGRRGEREVLGLGQGDEVNGPGTATAYRELLPK